MIGAPVSAAAQRCHTRAELEERDGGLELGCRDQTAGYFFGQMLLQQPLFVTDQPDDEAEEDQPAAPFEQNDQCKAPQPSDKDQRSIMEGVRHDRQEIANKWRGELTSIFRFMRATAKPSPVNAV